MQRGDSTNIRRLNGIHNTVSVASERQRIGWNTASWPQSSPLFHSFRIYPLYHSSRTHYPAKSSRVHPAQYPVPHPPLPSSSITKGVSSFVLFLSPNKSRKPKNVLDVFAWMNFCFDFLSSITDFCNVMCNFAQIRILGSKHKYEDYENIDKFSILLLFLSRDQVNFILVILLSHFSYFLLYMSTSILILSYTYIIY